MSDQPLIVVALGGNAISQPHQQGNVREQFANSRVTAHQLADLHEGGRRLAITHGNGPQIGNFLLRNDAAAGVIYPLDMEVAVAHVAGGMGFMIAQTLTNELRRRGHDLMAATVITTIRVDADDPAFRKPTKPIGTPLSKEAADAQAADEGWQFAEVAPGKFRRLVASPKPLEILELGLIRRCVEAGELVVTCGGGGVPVVRDEHGDLHGTRAVIDKDLASALLAAELDAEALLILTAVERVALDYGKRSQRELETMTVSKAETWLDEGQFPPGSMGPKVSAAIEFLRRSPNVDAYAAIGPLERAADTLTGQTGTRITR